LILKSENMLEIPPGFFLTHNSRKTSTSALLTMPKPLTVDHNKLENS